MFITLLAIFFLLLLSAFFSGSETALTAASRPLMHQLEQSGQDKRAEIVNRLLERKDRLLGAILLGNNLVNIMASALATSLMISVFGEAGVVYATAVMTLLVLIFAEILPKTYAMHSANSAALNFAPILRVIVSALAPVTQSIHLIVRRVLLLFGVDIGADPPLTQSGEELRGAIDLHAAEEEDQTKTERAMLRSVLDLSDVSVEEIMIHRKNVTAGDANLPSLDLVRAILESPHTRIPLYDGDPDNIIGVIHAKVLLRAIFGLAQHEIETIDVRALASAPWFIPEQTLLADQLQAFRERHEHFALVVDEYGGLMGIVTLEDIIEEIVGDITDEHDPAVAGVTSEPSGAYIVEGGVTLRDLKREFDWDLPDEDASTVAGLLLHESRRIPSAGQVFAFHGFRFEVLERRRHQITSVRVTPSKKETAESKAGGCRASRQSSDNPRRPRAAPGRFPFCAARRILRKAGRQKPDDKRNPLHAAFQARAPQTDAHPRHPLSGF
ncbi:MAG: HlyC/CorC family transporter [Rhodospirillales bacterium]